MLKDNFSQELLTELKSGLLKEFLECLPQEMTLAINKLELLITVTVKWLLEVSLELFTIVKEKDTVLKK